MIFSDPSPIIIRVGFWIIARASVWTVVNGLRTKMTVWLIAGGEWWENMEDKTRALTYYQHQSGFYQIKKIISYGSAWMNWEVFSVEHYDQRKNILNHTPPLNKIPSQSHRIILWPSKSLRISQPFHLENSPKNSRREYSWVIWCFGPLGKFRFLWHSNNHQPNKIEKSTTPVFTKVSGPVTISWKIWRWVNKKRRGCNCCGWVSLTVRAPSRTCSLRRGQNTTEHRDRGGGAAVSCHL